MEHLLTLTRAARLVRVPRGVLQKRIKSGELATFEGLVRPDDLLRLYPETNLEDTGAFERFARIKDEAYTRRVRERVLPDANVLAARLTALSREHAETKAAAERLHALLGNVEARLAGVAAADADWRERLDELRLWLGEALHPGPPAVARLAVADGMLRLMAAHVRLQPSGRDFFVEGSDTILAAALRNGLAVPYGCSDGSCGRCRARLVSGETQALDDRGLAEEEHGGYRLLCRHTAVTDLVLEVVEARAPSDIERQHLVAWVKGMRSVDADLMILRVQTAPANRLRFLAGQSVTVSIGDDLTADYAIASCPCEEGGLQFHVRRGRDPFSTYIFEGLRYGDVIKVTGPHGRFVLDPDSGNSILFLAWDSGFAPIKSLIEQSMALDVAESMRLWWGVPREGGHYLHNLCRSWADAFDNFSYTPVVGADVSSPDVRGWLAELSRVGLGGFDAYVAGPTAFVEAAAQALLSTGLPPEQLRAGVVA